MAMALNFESMKKNLENDDYDSLKKWLNDIDKAAAELEWRNEENNIL